MRLPSLHRSTPFRASLVVSALVAATLAPGCGPGPDAAPPELTDESSESAIAPSFSVGDRVSVQAARANVRASGDPVGPVIGTQPHGATAVVVDGPAIVGNDVRWRLDFDGGTDGWVWQPFLAAAAGGKWHPGHYALVGGSRLPRDSDLPTPTLRGVQKVYEWRKLEPTQGHYDFSEIDADLAFLASRGRYLIAQVTYKNFRAGESGAPEYILRGAAEYGPHRVYQTTSGSTNPSIWVPKVAGRFQAMLRALGAHVDAHPNLEMVNLPETALGPKSGPGDPHGVKYLATLGHTIQMEAAGVIDNMGALADGFPTSVKVQYINWGPLDDYLAAAQRLGVGMGGPDIHPARGSIKSYPYYPEMAGLIPTQGAVQYPDIFNTPKDESSGLIDPKKIFDFARGELKLNYLVWNRSHEAFFGEVVDMMEQPSFPAGAAGGLVAAPPAHR